jgi:hypothetical protein
VTQEALLCIAGTDANVKVYNVKQAELVKVSTYMCNMLIRAVRTDFGQTLVGHGGVSGRTAHC